MVSTAANCLSFLAFIWLPVSIYLTTCSPPFHLIGYSCDIEFLNRRKAPLFSERSVRSMTLRRLNLFPESTSDSHLSSEKAKVSVPGCPHGVFILFLGCPVSCTSLVRHLVLPKVTQFVCSYVPLLVLPIQTAGCVTSLRKYMFGIFQVCYF